MRLLYNLIQLLCLPLLLLFITLVILFRPEKRAVIWQRLGFGLRSSRKSDKLSKTIWIHALSVGEVMSALPLVRALRENDPPISLVFSATTVSGLQLAKEKIGPHVDDVFAFPLDVLPVVMRFIRHIRPDLFLLIETDFWPNILGQLSMSKVPSILINGRVSEKSMQTYQRYGFFFKPMFDNFKLVCVQTNTDAANLQRLGIKKSKLKTLGNLKYGAAFEEKHKVAPIKQLTPASHLLILCGSTHCGEELLLLEVFKNLQGSHNNLHLAIAPRDISRSNEIILLSQQFHLTSSLFSLHSPDLFDLLVIDTIGELSSLYSFADIAFIGGSLVAEGGHNPLEAARASCPVIFGPHMDDFAEISEELLGCNAAYLVTDHNSLESTLDRLLSSSQLRRDVGVKASSCIEIHRRVIPDHLHMIRKIL
jgi:3-deoxy-D-manno-octulosonic-acid transferase